MIDKKTRKAICHFRAQGAINNDTRCGRYLADAVEEQDREIAAKNEGIDALKEELRNLQAQLAEASRDSAALEARINYL